MDKFLKKLCSQVKAVTSEAAPATTAIHVQIENHFAAVEAERLQRSAWRKLEEADTRRMLKHRSWGN